MTSLRRLRMLRRHRRRVVGDETGFTAVEMAVAAAIMVIVSTIGFSAVGSVFGTGARALDKAQSTTSASQALSELRQEIVSGNVLYDPNSEFGTVCGTGWSPSVNCAGGDGAQIPVGFSLRIYTQNNGNYTCVQWRVDDGALQTRSWLSPPPSPAPKVPWTTLVTGVVNATYPSSGSPTTPFVAQGGNYEGLVNVELVLDQHGTTEAPVVVQSSIAARDAWHYQNVLQNQGFCSPVAPTP